MSAERNVNADLPKYALTEIERRWLVDDTAVVELAALPYQDIDDLYIAGTRLRLRRMVSQDQSVVCKLGKKYGKVSPLAEPITNLYLTEDEYERLAGLPGVRSRKRRFAVAGGSLDVYAAPHPGLAIFEREFADELAATAYEPPPFVAREITGEPAFDGRSLAGG
jgi:CYTH domain-containing protein